MEWQIIVALAIGIPLLLLPVAFIWYLNVSGLYRVMREARQREKRRARKLAGSKEFTGG